MPSYRDDVWNSLTATDPSYVQRAGGSKDSWIKDLTGSASFTVNLYKYLKSNNSDLVSDISTPQDFYNKITEGLGSGQPKQELSEEQQKFNDFYTTYKPILEGKQDKEIIQAFRTGKIGDLDINKNADYKYEVPKVYGKYEKGFKNPFDPGADARDFMQNPYGSFGQDEKQKKMTLIHGSYNDFTTRVMDDGVAKAKNNSSLTHSSAFDYKKYGQIKQQLKTLKDNGASDDLLDRLAYSNSNFVNDFADQSKIDVINPANKGFESDVIATRDAQGETVGFGGFVTNYLKSDAGTPFSPEIVNKWWNETTIRPLKQADPRFFSGQQHFSNEETNEEYEDLIENYNEALTYFRQSS